MRRTGKIKRYFLLELELNPSAEKKKALGGCSLPFSDVGKGEKV